MRDDITRWCLLTTDGEREWQVVPRPAGLSSVPTFLWWRDCHAGQTAAVPSSVPLATALGTHNSWIRTDLSGLQYRTSWVFYLQTKQIRDSAIQSTHFSYEFLFFTNIKWTKLDIWVNMLLRPAGLPHHHMYNVSCPRGERIFIFRQVYDTVTTPQEHGPHHAASSER